MDLLEMLSSLFMLLCSVLGIVCAIVFIVVVTFHRQCHTLTIMLILNSTIAGVVINVTCGCQAIYQLLGDANDELCAFRGFLLHSATGLLYQTLCVQALHRLFVIVFSTRRYLQSVHVMLPIVIFQWLVSITFGIPTLVAGQIVYQPGSRICQASLEDLRDFLYLAMFIYFCPIAIIIPIYIRIVHYMKQNSFSTNVRRTKAERHRQRRELRLIRRILLLVAILLFMSFPYLIFFLRAQFTHLKQVPYAQRVSFLSLSFGYGICMLLNLVNTDQVKQCLINLPQHARPTRIQRIAMTVRRVTLETS